MMPVSGSAYAYCVRDARRGRRLVHRLEPGARIPVRGVDRRGRLVAATSVKLLRRVRHQLHPGGAQSAPLDYTIGRAFIATGAMINLPAVLIVAVVTVHSGARHPRSRRRSTRSSSRSRSASSCCSSRSARSTSSRELASVHSAEHRRVRASSAGAASCAASGIIFFAYIGFDAVSTAAQEAKNPQRDMPIGILGSLVICTILYILDVGRADRHARRIRSSNDAAPVAAALRVASGAALADDLGRASARSPASPR